MIWFPYNERRKCVHNEENVQNYNVMNSLFFFNLKSYISIFKWDKSEEVLIQISAQILVAYCHYYLLLKIDIMFGRYAYEW